MFVLRKPRVRFSVERIERRSPLTHEPGDVQLTDSFVLLPWLTPDERLVSNFLGGYTQKGSNGWRWRGRGFSENDLYGFLHEFGGSIAGTLTFRVPGVDVRQRHRTNR